MRTPLGWLEAMMRTPLMIESPSRPGTDQRDLAWRRLAAAELWPSVNRRPSIHSADTQVQTGPACEWSGEYRSRLGDLLSAT